MAKRSPPRKPIMPTKGRGKGRVTGAQDATTEPKDASEPPAPATGKARQDATSDSQAQGGGAQSGSKRKRARPKRQKGTAHWNKVERWVITNACRTCC